jgi:hypothetical protein
MSVGSFAAISRAAVFWVLFSSLDREEEEESQVEGIPF